MMLVARVLTSQHWSFSSGFLASRFQLMLMMLFAVLRLHQASSGADAHDARCFGLVLTSFTLIELMLMMLTGPTGRLSFPSQADSS